MNRPSPLLALRRLQRRFSLVLAGALCLWMLAVASHFHVDDYESTAHHGTHELCAFCVSVPSSGAAPVVVAFITAPQRHVFSTPAEILPTIAAPAVARYYSRGPPRI